MSVTPFIHRMSNGLTVVGEQNPAAFSTAFSLMLPLGAQHDPQGKLGLSSLAQDLLFKGAGPWDAQALATEIDRIGWQEGHRAERELITFAGTVLPQHLFTALDITWTVLNEPHLPQPGLDEVRQLAQFQLMSLEDSPAQKMFYELGRRFFPHPLSNPAEGALETLPNIALDDVKKFLQGYGPNGAVLSVAGNFDEKALLDHLSRQWAKWAGPQTEPPPLSANQHHIEHIEQDTEQTQIGVAYPSVPLAHPDYHKARMGVMALSSGMSSRLFVEVRQKRGLAYSVFASYISTRARGGVLGYAGTTSERAQETLDVLLAELRRVADGITQDEFNKAKTKLKTNFILQGESNRARAEAMVREYFHRGEVRGLDEVLARIEALTLDDVNHYLSTAVPSDFTILTLGKQALGVTA